MKEETMEVMERLEAAASTLEAALKRMEERQRNLTGKLERISATVETHGDTVSERLSAAEREIERLRTELSGMTRVEAGQGRLSQALAPLRRTLPSATVEMLAKHGIGDEAVDVRKLDAALQGLSLEQRIAVKSQLRRAGAM